MQSFGGPWTLLKLDVLEKYLNFYVLAMKNQNFKPYAMNLHWDSLSSIAKTKAFDVWYLFPLSAVNRVLPRHGNIPESHRQKLHQVLGTTSWEQEIYHHLQ